MSKTTIVIPCYNEQARLDLNEYRRFFTVAGIQLLFVNDGSTDKTAEMLWDFSSENAQAQCLDLEKNLGKAEAVRQGLLLAIEQKTAVVGYLDSDLATPVSEVIRLIDLIRNKNIKVLLASRVQLLGRKIDRRRFRHYTGRVFATIASLIIDLPVYDTQCGAKFFQVTSALERAVTERFISRWIFDIELLMRLKSDSDTQISDFVEEPLLEWKDVRGSKLRLADFFGVLTDLIRISMGKENRNR